MNWLSTVLRKQKRERKSGFSGADNKNLTSSWKISPEADESTHDKWWDISKSHNRWVRLGIKTYDNANSPSTYIGLRLFKPDFESGQWNRQSHFSFTVDELTCLATCLGLGDKSAVEAAGLSQNVPQEFNRYLENVLCGVKANDDSGSSVSSFVGKKSTVRKLPGKSAAIANRPGAGSHINKRKTDRTASASKSVKGGDEKANTSQQQQTDSHKQGNDDKRIGIDNCDVQTQMDMCQITEDELENDDVFMN